MGLIFRWVLELTECGCAYYLICNMMICHVRIEECKTWVLHHILIYIYIYIEREREREREREISIDL